MHAPQTASKAPWLRALFLRLAEWLFAAPPPGHFVRGITETAFLFSVFVGDAFYWVRFFCYGLIDRSVYDWVWEYPFHGVLQVALRTLRMPFYASFNYYGTDHVLAIPNIPLSPHVIALRWMPLGAFFVFNAILLYALGCHGCLLLKRRYRLSLVSFRLLVLLCLFNGYIVSHLGVGHVEFTCCFLLPYFAYCTLDIRKDFFPFRYALQIVLLFFVMLLQGGLHVVILCALYLALLTAFQPSGKTLLRLAQIAGMTLFLGAVKLVPALLFFGSAERSFLLGYTSIGDLLNALTVLRDHTTPRLVNLGSAVDPFTDWAAISYPWEHNAYIGFAGFLFLAICGIWWRMRTPQGLETRTFASHDGPLLLITFFTIEANFYLIRALHIPFLSVVERAPSRFTIVLLVILAAIATVRYQRYLDAHPQHAWARAVGFLAFIHVGFMLLLHARAWEVGRIAATMTERFIPFTPTSELVAGHDPLYVWTFIGSALVSFAGLAWWVYAYRRACAMENNPA